MLANKKIILFASTDISYDQRMIKICNSLQGNDFEVCFVGRTKNKTKLKNSFSFKTVNLNCIFNKGFLFYLEFNVRIFFHVLFHNAAVYTANDLDTVFGLALASRFQASSKLVFDAHEYFTEVPELKNKKRKKAIWEWIEKRYLPKFDALYTVNESLANIFYEKLNLQFKVIKNVPVLAKTKKTYKKNKEKYILYQGALNKGRGLEQMIDAMPNINLKLKIAGTGDIENDLKRQVKALNLEDEVIFLGALKPADLKVITQGAFIGINFLENTSLNYYYSLANKFFDYMHQSIPQIGMNFPEYKAINNQYEVAVLIKNLDRQAILNAVKKISSVNLYQQLQQNTKQAQKKYAWHKEEQHLLEIYHNLF